jgi:hypothetical protein
MTARQRKWLQENPRPFRYSVVYLDKDGEIIDEQRQNEAPITWQCKIESEWRRAASYRAYVRPRYDAEIRLWKYRARKQGLETEYRPYKGTEIGKTIPILGF